LDGATARIELPFDPNEVWGPKDRHHITGTVGGVKIRGELRKAADGYEFFLGPAWVRDCAIDLAQELRVELAPEGPPLGPDLIAALDAAPAAKRFFESLPTFYRKNFVRWIDSAKRPETRANRIAATIRLLSENKRER
jgi:hypothetical protein